MATTENHDVDLVVLKGGIRTAAKLLDEPERSLYRKARAGQLPFVAKVGAKYLIPLAAWNRWQQDPQGFERENATAE